MSNPEPTPTEDTPAAEVASKSRKGLVPLALVLLLGIGFVALMIHLSLRNSVLDVELNRRLAYLHVHNQNVAVNGDQGTPEWRGYYAQGLERFLLQHDFDEACTDNGFLREASLPRTLPCISVGELRAVRTTDGTISYFREESYMRRTILLDVLQQDIHADDYLDIDRFSKEVRERAIMIVREAEEKKRADEQAERAHERAKWDAEFKKSMERSRRVLEESRRALGDTYRPALALPPTEHEEGANLGDVATPPIAPQARDLR